MKFRQVVKPLWNVSVTHFRHAANKSFILSFNYIFNPCYCHGRAIDYWTIGRCAGCWSLGARLIKNVTILPVASAAHISYAMCDLWPTRRLARRVYIHLKIYKMLFTLITNISRSAVECRYISLSPATNLIKCMNMTAVVDVATGDCFFNQWSVKLNWLILPVCQMKHFSHILFAALCTGFKINLFTTLIVLNHLKCLNKTVTESYLIRQLQLWSVVILPN